MDIYIYSHMFYVTCDFKYKLLVFFSCALCGFILRNIGNDGNFFFVFKRRGMKKKIEEREREREEICLWWHLAYKQIWNILK